MKVFHGISEKLDPRPRTFGVTGDLRPWTHLVGVTEDLRLRSLKVAPET